MPSLDLTPDEALVLFELCERFSEARADTLTLVHPAETVAMWAITGALERALSEPFLPEYEALLNAARERLATRAGLTPESSE